MPGESYKIFPLRAGAGIKKDTTDTEGNYWSDGNWVRFYRQLPRSMLGYRSMSEQFPGPSRGLFTDPAGNGYQNVFSGSASQLVVGQFSNNGFGSAFTDITPSGFVTSPNNVWQMDSAYDSSGSGVIYIVAHAAQNLSDINNTIAAPVYYGNINGTSALTASAAQAGGNFTIDGGVVVAHPFVVAYGNPGLVCWTAANDPTSFPTANAANPCSSKIVKGLSIRGGSNNPSVLLWSTDSVIQMSYVGGSTVWNFNTLSDQSSILSSSSVVEMDGIYYWPGIDRFLTFNGVLQELPNEMNLDFFFSNLNFAQRQKVFGFKIPRWGEIWWCAPLFGATECNWAVIFNKRENCWYSTPLPSDGRSAAYFAQSFPFPIMGSATGLTPIGQNSGTVYPLYQHETGYDFVRGQQVNAIDSWILSPTASMVGGGLSLWQNAGVEPQSVQTQLCFHEPDYKFGTSMQFTTLGRNYAMDADTVLDMRTITQQSANNFYDLQVQSRYLRWKIESNVQGGFFQMGQPLLYYRPGDSTP